MVQLSLQMTYVITRATTASSNITKVSCFAVEFGSEEASTSGVLSFSSPWVPISRAVCSSTSYDDCEDAR